MTNPNCPQCNGDGVYDEYSRTSPEGITQVRCEICNTGDEGFDD